MSAPISQDLQEHVPTLPPAVDTHLIMNAMNQIAARDISLSGTENPLLFALSDYLRESLSKLDAGAVNVRADVRHAETHLMLHACVAHSTLSMDISGCPADMFKVPRGTLPVLAVGCTKALRLPANARWHVDLRFDPSVREDEWVRFSMSFSTPGKALLSEWSHAVAVVQALPLVVGGGVVFDASSSSSDTRSFTLFFRARLFY